jgi:cytochrome c
MMLGNRGVPTQSSEQGERAGVRTSALSQGEASSSSPVRWLLVLVPLLIAVIGGAYLAASWIASMQRAELPSTREQRRADKPTPADYGLPPAGDAPPPRPPIPFNARAVLGLLAKANAEDGARAFRMCSACHAGEKGAPARLGPNLWGVVGRRMADDRAFAYSAALKAKGGTWGYEELIAYLHNPRALVPGTSMAFAGIQDEVRMANLIAYMRTLADDPMPLPK